MVPGSFYKTVPLQSSAVATGNGTEIVITGNTDGGLLGMGLQITGITTATVTFEATVDGTNWVAIQAENKTDASKATTATANGIYYVVVHGVLKFRARISAYTSGAITITALAAA